VLAFGDFDNVIVCLALCLSSYVKPSGHFTFRVWFGYDEIADNIRDGLLEEITNAGCLLEWYSEHLLGIDCAAINAQQVANLLYVNEKNGFLNYETGRKA
jgi:hypothetical protein